VQFTEVDVRLPNNNAANLSVQAQNYKDLLNICLQQPACTAFQTWGFTDKHSWIPAIDHGHGWALPFDQNYRKKPAYFAMLKKLNSYSGTRVRFQSSR
jgi:endo-1,4-beta-xylanase